MWLPVCSLFGRDAIQALTSQSDAESKETSMVISTAGRRGDPQCGALCDCDWNVMYRTRRLLVTNARYALKFADQDSGHRP
jgi:hypothetical protein